jgi:hypothetical protein
MLEVSLSVVVSEEGEIVLWMELAYFRLVVIKVLNRCLLLRWPEFWALLTATAAVHAAKKVQVAMRVFSPAMMVRASVASTATRRMGVEVYRRGEIVASPLRNPPPSEVPPRSAALQPSWFALQVEVRLWGNSQAWVISVALVAVQVEAPEAQAALGALMFAPKSLMMVRRTKRQLLVVVAALSGWCNGSERQRCDRAGQRDLLDSCCMADRKVGFSTTFGTTLVQGEEILS